MTFWLSMFLLWLNSYLHTHEIVVPSWFPFQFECQWMCSKCIRESVKVCGYWVWECVWIFFYIKNWGSVSIVPNNDDDDNHRVVHYDVDRNIVVCRATSSLFTLTHLYSSILYSYTHTHSLFPIQLYFSIVGFNYFHLFSFPIFLLFFFF